MTGGHKRRRTAHLVQDIVTYGVRHLVAQLQVPEADAQAVMRAVAHAVCAANAKCVIYVPGDQQWALIERDISIYRAYQVTCPTGARPVTGERVQELAAEHNLTIQQVYNVIRRLHREEMADRQGVLPGLESAE
jgi:Mor family transcriptional regulator